MRCNGWSQDLPTAPVSNCAMMPGKLNTEISGVLLRLVSPLAKWKVHVTPRECIDCKLCETACPYGQINRPTREGAAADP